MWAKFSPFILVIFLAVGIVEVYGYGDFNTHARITAKSVEIVINEPGFSEFGSFHNATLFHEIQSNDHNHRATQFDLSRMHSLGFLPVVGAICEDESSPRYGCPQTNTFRSLMHFIEHRESLALPYEVWVYKRTVGCIFGFCDANSDYNLMDLFGSFSITGENAYDFFDSEVLESNKFVEPATLSFHTTGETIVRTSIRPPVFETVIYDIDKYEDGHRFINSYTWGLDGGDTPHENHFNLTWKGAIDSYNSGTREGRADAYAKLGHVAHLIQDATVPEHVALQAHPSGGFDSNGLVQIIQENRVNITNSFGEMVNEQARRAVLGQFIVCEGIRNEGEVGTDFYNQLIERISEHTNSRGYENFTASQWSIARFNAFDTDPYFSPTYTLEDYYDEAIRASHSLINDEMRVGVFVEHDGRQDQIGGLMPSIRIDDLHLDTTGRATGCPDANLDLEIFMRGIPMINDENEDLYREISDLQVEKAIQLTSGMFKTFYSAVNPPPYVSEFKLWQSPDLVKYVESYRDIFLDGKTSPDDCPKKSGAYVKHCVVVAREKHIDFTNQESVKKNHPTKISIAFANGPVEQRKQILCLPQSEIEGDVDCTVTGYDPIITVIAKSNEPLDREYENEARLNYDLIEYRTDPLPLGTPSTSHYYRITIPIEGSWVDRPFSCPGLDCSMWFGSFDMPRFLEDADFELTIDVVESNPTFSTDDEHVRQHAEDLDFDPTTVTKADYLPPYSWNGYEPGKHIFRVSLQPQ